MYAHIRSQNLAEQVNQKYSTRRQKKDDNGIALSTYANVTSGGREELLGSMSGIDLLVQLKVLLGTYFFCMVILVRILREGGRVLVLEIQYWSKLLHSLAMYGPHMARHTPSLDHMWPYISHIW